jgi:CheY-like chemotaxis protein
MSAFVPRLDLSKATVLVIDDSAHAMEIASQIFLGFGVRQIQRAASAEEGCKLSDSTAFDLILVDAELPEASGFDYVRKVRRDGLNRSTAIILVSGFTPKSKVEEARDSGANVVLTKPLIPGALLDHISAMSRSTRQFVRSDTYCGPDRRFHNRPLQPGQEERRADSLALIAQPERALSQSEINSLFD